MKRFLTAPVAALAVLLLVAAGAHADPAITWSYNWAPQAGPSGSAVLADGNNAAGVTFTNDQQKFSHSFSTDIVATNLKVFSTADDGTPDKITGSNGNYSLSLTLGLSGTQQTATLTFTGQLGGTFSATSANVTNTWMDAGAGVEKTATLTNADGTYKFHVTLGNYSPPGPPLGDGDSLKGAMTAHVTIEHITPTGVPEPSTILLSGMGLTFFGGAALRRLRKGRQPA
jgi:hypothetical protein